MEACQDPNSTADRIGPLVVLVHGTFARDADWIRRGSKLCNTLEQRFPHVRWVRFRWSGRNNHEDRLTAGRELALRFKRAAQFPGLRSDDNCGIYFVGHSHGGNVILHAMKEPELSARTKGAIFLGTPFLSLESGIASIATAPIAFLTTWLLPFIFQLILSPFLLAPVSILEGLEIIKHETAQHFATVYFLSFLAFLPLYYWLLVWRFGPWFSAWLPRQIERGASRVAELVKTPYPNCPTFIATVRADEAGFLLRSIDLLTLAPLRLYGLVAQSIMAMIVALFTMSFVSIPIDPTANDLPGIEAMVLAVIGLALTTVIVPLPLVLIASWIRGSPIGFGGETATMVAARRIKPMRWPDWEGRPGSERRTWSIRRTGALKHSFFYANSEVLNAVADWMAISESQTDVQEAMLEPREPGELVLRPTVIWLFRIVPFLLVAAAYVAIWVTS